MNKIHIEKFIRFRGKPLLCLAFDTTNTRYFYDLTHPFYLEWFKIHPVDDELNPDISSKKHIGYKNISILFLLTPICHLIHHIEISWWWKKWHGHSFIRELFSNWNDKQRQIIDL